MGKMKLIEIKEEKMNSTMNDSEGLSPWKIEYGY
jgi:hypothetical protein